MSMLNIINISLLKCHSFISAGGFPSFLKRRKIRNQQEIYSPSRRWAFFINVKIKTETELKKVLSYHKLILIYIRKSLWEG